MATHTSTHPTPPRAVRVNPSPTTRRILWAFGLFAALALAGPAFAQGDASGKFDSVVREAVRNGQPVNVIVRFADEAARSRGASTVAGRGGRVRRALNDIGALSATMDAETATALAGDAGVAGISIDATVYSSASPSHGPVTSSAAAKPRQNHKGSGNRLTVAVIDSGVRPHTDLPASRIREFVDFVNGASRPYDDFGHGTHVAGVLAGSGAASLKTSTPFVGTAPEVDIVALKVLDGKGAGRTSDVIAALEWVAAHHTTYNIRVVNLSLGHPVFEPAATDPMVQAAEALVRRGIVVVASAGNQGIDPRDQQVGYGGTSSPANGPSIIAVGAVDAKGTSVRRDDEVTDYSSRGPTRFDLSVKPDIVAVGHHVVSLSAPGSFLFENYPSLRVAAGSEKVASYMRLSGTSMAAPVVAGVAALMLDHNAGLSAGAVRAVLEFTASRLPQTDLMTQGAGYLNALGAVRLAGLIKPGVPLGTVWLRSPGGLPGTSDELFGEQVGWGKHVVWGDKVLLGDSAYFHMAAWHDNIVWGQTDNIVWGQDNIVWGQCTDAGCDNIVWGQDNIVWGQDNIVWWQCSDAGCDNIVWGQGDNIVWGQSQLDNIVWGQCETVACNNIVWGQDNIVWGQDNIVWGQDNIVWGQDNIVWGQDNIVWGQSGLLLEYWADNTVWGFWSDAVNWSTVSRQHADNIVWGQDYLDNIVWGQDNIVWGQDNIVWGQNLAILTEGAK
ncbi:MAG: S8 family serine peptidase [Acidobacteriota bacterium]